MLFRWLLILVILCSPTSTWAEEDEIPLPDSPVFEEIESPRPPDPVADPEDPWGGLLGSPTDGFGSFPKAPLYRFDSSRPLSDVAFVNDFDRVLDTPIFENQGGTILTGKGVCYGYNLTTVDWFQLVTRPRLRVLEKALAEVNDPKLLARSKRKDSKRLRAFSTPRDQRREIARRVLQY